MNGEGDNRIINSISLGFNIGILAALQAISDQSQNNTLLSHLMSIDVNKMLIEAATNPLTDAEMISMGINISKYLNQFVDTLTQRFQPEILFELVRNPENSIEEFIRIFNS